MVLAHWLREQYPQAAITLEERLPEPNRIADVFVSHSDGDRWAVEFQCAPLDVDEWRHRHTAYHKAGIVDIWIIGNNRYEKQEAFIEAIMASAREILFLDPLVTPPQAWLRWPVSRDTIQAWQYGGTAWTPALEGWVGRLGYGVSLVDRLPNVRLGESGMLVHPARSTLAARTHLFHTMSEAASVDENTLAAYLRQQVSEDALYSVMLPLVRAYLRDPGLLRRYNFGRGSGDQSLSEEDSLRVQRARHWLHGLEQKGFTTATLQDLLKEIPFVGPYTAFARYFEMLLTLW
jgi:hypothetical protein